MKWGHRPTNGRRLLNEPRTTSDRANEEMSLSAAELEYIRNRLNYQPWLERTKTELSEQKAFQDILRRRAGAVSIGANCFISTGAHVYTDHLSIGENSWIAAGAIVRGHVTIGSNSSINPLTHVAGRVTIGSDVRIAGMVSIYGFNHGFSSIDRPIYRQPHTSKGIVVCDGTWIGANAVLIDGVRVGAHCIVAAGAVVTKDLPDYSIAGGNPAVVLEDRRSPRKSAPAVSVKAEKECPVPMNQLTFDIPWIDRDDADIEAFAKTYQTPVSFDLVDKLTSWKRNGFVVFRSVVSHDLIDKLIADVNHLRDRFHDYLIPIEVRGQQTWSKAVSREIIEGSGVKFNHLHTSSLYAARLSLTREVTEFLEAIFGSPATPMQSLTFWMGSQQPTHIDYPYVRMQRRLAYMAASWIPLEDVHPDAGPLAYYPGAHKPAVSGFFDWGQGDIVSRPETSTKNGQQFADYLDSRLREQNIQPEIFTPRKGDVLIWHCNMPHTGTPIRNVALTRKSYVTHYTGLRDYPERWLPDEAMTATRTITENRGVIMDFPWSKPESKLPSWRGHFNPVEDSVGAT